MEQENSFAPDEGFYFQEDNIPAQQNNEEPMEKNNLLDSIYQKSPCKYQNDRSHPQGSVPKPKNDHSHSSYSVEKQLVENLNISNNDEKNRETCYDDFFKKGEPQNEKESQNQRDISIGSLSNDSDWQELYPQNFDEQKKQKNLPTSISDIEIEEGDSKIKNNGGSNFKNPDDLINKEDLKIQEQNQDDVKKSVNKRKMLNRKNKQQNKGQKHNNVVQKKKIKKQNIRKIYNKVPNNISIGNYIKSKINCMVKYYKKQKCNVVILLIFELRFKLDLKQWSSIQIILNKAFITKYYIFEISASIKLEKNLVEKHKIESIVEWEFKENDNNYELISIKKFIDKIFNNKEIIIKLEECKKFSVLLNELEGLKKSETIKDQKIKIESLIYVVGILKQQKESQEKNWMNNINFNQTDIKELYHKHPLIRQLIDQLEQDLDSLDKEIELKTLQREQIMNQFNLGGQLNIIFDSYLEKNSQNDLTQELKGCFDLLSSFKDEKDLLLSLEKLMELLSKLENQIYSESNPILLQNLPQLKNKIDLLLNSIPSLNFQLKENKQFYSELMDLLKKLNNKTDLLMSKMKIQQESNFISYSEYNQNLYSESSSIQQMDLFSEFKDQIDQLLLLMKMLGLFQEQMDEQLKKQMDQKQELIKTVDSLLNQKSLIVINSLLKKLKEPKEDEKKIIQSLLKLIKKVQSKQGDFK